MPSAPTALPAPNCGAPVDFQSAASASAVCGFCRSTLVREGDALRRIGESAELFDDYSPLQIGARGRYQGEPFVLVGRLQMAYAEGVWNEWHVLFDAASDGQGGKRGWLSEDNGAFVFSFDQPEAAFADGPDADTWANLRVGLPLTWAGRRWSVAAVTSARVGAAQGELPAAPSTRAEFRVVELRNERDEVGSLDDAQVGAAAVGSTAPGARVGMAGTQPLAGLRGAIGRAVRLADLSLQGLRESSDKAMAGRSFDCPSCGSALSPQLGNSLSIVCGQCHAVVDLSGAAAGGGQATQNAPNSREDLAAGLKHYAQEGADHEPLIPLGRTGQMAFGALGTLPWQVVGYLERCDLPAPGSDDEQTFWREYLLYHRSEGFIFLVDAEDGWSWMRPLTGAPSLRGSQVNWQSDAYRQQWQYTAKTTYVLGEFYWQVKRDERVLVTDYIGAGGAARKRMSREQTGAALSGDAGGGAGKGTAEITWSAGATLDAADIAKAFKLTAKPGSGAASPFRKMAPVDISPASSGMSWRTVLFLVIFLLIVVALMSTCSSNNCDQVAQTFGTSSVEYQQCARSGGGHSTSGGSWGGFSGTSGGGGHK